MRRITITDEATRWLHGYLAEHGPTLYAELITASPYAPTTLRRAANKLGVISVTQPGFRRSTIWTLGGRA